MLTQGTDLKLSLKGSVEQASSTRAGSVEDAENRIGWRLLVRPKSAKEVGSRIGGSRKAVGQIFREGIILGVSVGAHL